MTDVKELIARLRSAHSDMTPGAIERADIDGIAFTIEEAATALEAALSGTREAVEPVAKSRVDWPAEITNCPFCNAANVYLCKPWKDARHRVECNMCRASGPVKTSAQSAVDAWAFFTVTAPPSDPVGHDAVTVPQAAIDWLMGAGPDEDGHYFGDSPKDNIRGAFWWRSRFRSMIALSPAPEAGSDEVERLKAELSEAIRRGEDQWAGWVKETAALRAAEARETALRDQLGKMREALGKIAGQKKTSQMTGYEIEYACFQDGYDFCIDHARATLAETQEAGR